MSFWPKILLHHPNNENCILNHLNFRTYKKLRSHKAHKKFSVTLRLSFLQYNRTLNHSIPFFICKKILVSPLRRRK